MQERMLQDLGKKHGVRVTVTKSVNGSVTLEGDADGIASVIDELMQFMLDLKTRSASQREAELLAKQVAHILIYVHLC